MKLGVGSVMVVLAAAVVWMAATAVNQAQPAAGAAGGTRLGVVDIVRVFDTFEQTQVLNRQQEAHLKSLGEEADRKSQEIQAEQAQLQAMNPNTADYYKQNQKVKKMMIDFEVWRQVERDNIGENHKRWIEKTYVMMVEEIERVARKRGMQVVLTRERLKTDVPDSKALLAQILNIKVVYADSDPSIDITEEVLANLNAAFQKAGGAAAVKFNP